MQTQPLLTIPQVCERLNVSHKTVRKEIKDMRLAGTKIRGEWRFTPESIDEYIKSRTTKVKKVPA